MDNYFDIQCDEQGCITLLRNKTDVNRMNWAQGEIPWGTVKLPEGMEVEKKHRITEEGVLEERYLFRNKTDYPIYFKETDIGIYISLPDSYVDSDECMKRHCHTHIWCGQEASWIKALRMSGIGPHLGMALKKGSLKNYSIRRNEQKSSNDRGSFLLHPEIETLQAGESYEICWEWFWFDKAEGFEQILLEKENVLLTDMQQCTYFIGEKAVFQIRGKGSPKTVSVLCKTSTHVTYRCEEKEGTFTVFIELDVESTGENQVDIAINGIKTKVVLFGSVAIEELVEARCKFITQYQQESSGVLKGAYLIYDRETQKRYYSHLDDHNGGRERLAMGALIALWLQNRENIQLEKSLNQYIAYVYRELFDAETGDVFNDAGKNMEWDRLYNYPWMSTFLMEIYKWKHDSRYLADAYKALKRYYEKDGKTFYAIGIQALELIALLEKEGLDVEAADIKIRFQEHAEHIREKGLHFPKSEVNYEQSIVAPAVSILLQAYKMTGQYDFLEAAQEMMTVLKLFNGRQPDYHLFENSIRHWDGYWFGKRRCLGDTFPHYWSVLNAVCYAAYGNMERQEEYLTLAKASLRGCLNLFDEKGNASCAMVYPESINGRQAHYYDPWANDQDWALYYAWKMKEIII